MHDVDGEGLETRSAATRSPGVTEDPLEELLDGLDNPIAHLGDRYHALGILGRGGMGSVYLAHDREMGRRVALKLQRGRSPDRDQQALMEVRTIARLQHPGIVRIYDCDVAPDGSLYYTMPVLRGLTLRSALDAEGTMASNLARRLRILLRVSQAVVFAHVRGVLHRDLKPSNIMLLDSDEVLVLDWGLSVALSGNGQQTRSIGRSGTPGYMAPEQIRGELASERTDVYALGCILFELLAGRRCFMGSDQELLDATLTRAPASPSSLIPNGVTVPAELDDLCLEALATDPARRLPSASILTHRLQAWLDADSERTERARRAGEKLADGQRWLAHHAELRTRSLELRDRASTLRPSESPYGRSEDSARRRAIEETLRDLRRQMFDAETEAVLALTICLEHADEPRARRLLCDHDWQRLEDAEAGRSTESIADITRRLLLHDDGTYRARLERGGELHVITDQSVDVSLCDIDERAGRFVPVRERHLGQTPLAPFTLAPGNYLMLLRRPNRTEVRAPILVQRERFRVVRVVLPDDGEEQDGFIFVPGGPFLVGATDPDDGRLMCHEVAVRDVDGFFIGRHPVTFGEYRDFLQSLLECDGPAAVARHTPRTHEGIRFAAITDAGNVVYTEEDDLEAQGIHPRHPVSWIRRFDADAYIDWRSARDGRRYRLPTDLEWEKAARGVDGRRFPWGNTFDLSFANLLGSRRTAYVEPVDESRNDVSIYGVVGMAGNISEIVDSPDQSSTIVRGGSYYFTERRSRCHSRLVLPDRSLPRIHSFRLAYSSGAG